MLPPLEVVRLWAAHPLSPNVEGYFLLLGIMMLAQVAGILLGLLFSNHGHSEV